MTDRQEESLAILRRAMNVPAEQVIRRTENGDLMVAQGDVKGVSEGGVAVWIQPPRTSGLLNAMLVDVRADGSLGELA